MLDRWALDYHGWKKRVAWWVYQRRDLATARVLHATADSEADGFRSLGWRQPIAVIPNGLDLPEACRSRDEIGSHVSRGGAGDRTVLFLSRLNPKKGLLTLVQAWCALRPEGWRVVVAGGDEAGELARAEAWLLSHGLRERFEFLGEVPDREKWDLYRHADLFVLPSASENFGLVIAEALGCGVPVITTRATPWRELVSHECGWWIEPGVESLVGALRRAVALKDAERYAMGERGRRLVKSRYTWTQAAEQMRTVYEWVAGFGERPSCVSLRGA
jgi:glycosyltransferase involved in cell wall biosynthesis